MSAATPSAVAEGPPAAGAAVPGAMAHFLRSGAIYWGAMLVVGVFNLTFSLIAARGLGPASYGALAAIVALINVFLIAASALTRTVTAVVAAGQERATGAFVLRRATLAALAAGLAAALLVGALARPLAGLLHLQRPAWIWIAGASLLPALGGGVTTGILQGLRLFLASGAVNLASAVAKLGLLLLLLRAGAGIGGAALATLAEVTLIFLLAYPWLRALFRGVAALAPAAAGGARIALPSAVTVARLIFFNLDILVARHYLGAEAAGLFAALAVTGRIIAYGTGALPPVVYPYLVRHRRDAALSLRYLAVAMGATALAGGGAIGVLLLAPGPVVRILFGSAFAGIAPYVGWYGLAFLLYSLMYVLLHHLLAAESWWVWVYALGGGLLEIAALALLHGGIGRLTAVETAFFAVMFAATAAHSVILLRRRPAAA